LKQKHEKEMLDFEESWQTPEKARIYSHASNQLMNLRAQSVRLLQARRYDDQRKAAKVAEILERNETEEHSRAMMKEYEDQMKSLEERQIQERDHLRMANEARLSLVGRSKEDEIQAVKRRIMNIEMEMVKVKDCERVWNVMGRTEKMEVMRNLPRVRPSRTRAESRMNMREICGLKLPPLKAMTLRNRNSQLVKRRRPKSMKQNNQ
jgi:hypothetical protein